MYAYLSSLTLSAHLAKHNASFCHHLVFIVEGPLLLLLSSFQFVNQHGYHSQFLFLIDRFLESFYTETALVNEPKFDGNHVLNVLYNDFAFHPNPLENMATIWNSCF